MTPAAATRPRLQQTFPHGDPVALALNPAEALLDTGDDSLTARLALAVLLTRSPEPAATARYPFRYAALDAAGGVLADSSDPVVGRLCALLARHGADRDGQAAALAALRPGAAG
jgi:hypothetical protein